MSLTHQPRTFNKSQTEATNKAKNRCYQIFSSIDHDYIKSVTKSVNTFNEHFYLRVRLEKTKVRTNTNKRDEFKLKRNQNAKYHT